MTSKPLQTRLDQHMKTKSFHRIHNLMKKGDPLWKIKKLSTVKGTYAAAKLVEKQYKNKTGATLNI